MKPRTIHFIGGPLHGEVRTEFKKGEGPIYRDDEGNALPTGRANSTKRGFYSRSGRVGGPFDKAYRYKHVTVPIYKDDLGYRGRKIPGHTGWSMWTGGGLYSHVSQPTWNASQERWECQVLEEFADPPILPGASLDKIRGANWVLKPSGPLLFPTAVEWAREHSGLNT